MLFRSLTNHFITKETAVSIIGLVNDPTGELKKAQKQFEDENKKNDNTGTMQKLLDKRIAEANLPNEDEESEEENEENGTNTEGEVNGEMVNAVAQRLFRILYSMEAAG